MFCLTDYVNTTTIDVTTGTKYQFDQLKETKKCKSTINIPVDMMFQNIKAVITATDLPSDFF